MLVLLPDVSPIVQCYAYFLMLVLLSFINVSHNSFLAFISVMLVLCHGLTDSLHRLTKSMQPFTIRCQVAGRSREDVLLAWPGEEPGAKLGLPQLSFSLDHWMAAGGRCQGQTMKTRCDIKTES